MDSRELPPRDRAAGVLGPQKLRQLEEAGLRVVDAEEEREPVVQAAWDAHAELVQEYGTGSHTDAAMRVVRAVEDAALHPEPTEEGEWNPDRYIADVYHDGRIVAGNLPVNGVPDVGYGVAVHKRSERWRLTSSPRIPRGGGCGEER